MAPSSPPGQQQVGQDAAASSPPAGSSVPAGIVPNAAMDGSWLATCVEERQLGEVRVSQPLGCAKLGLLVA